MRTGCMRGEEATMANRNSVDDEFVPPTPEDVDRYIAYLGWPADFDGWMFCDYYEAQGWVTGTGRDIKSWRPLVRQWLRNPRKW